MGKYEIKKVLAVDNNLSLRECEKMIFSEDCCLGILDENREVISFVTKEDLIKVLRFNLDNYSINLIATLT
ncbi:MAG: hypothetical protein PHC34_13860, partial [Candidatus Gastranaerophilales bacterium]|nr:hypothetical protein [Candidatus Gastranaerophilales bacterium]